VAGGVAVAFAPQLAMSVNPNKLNKYADDDKYFFEQKLDGVRLVIVVDNGNVIGWNRSGNQITLGPILIEALERLNGRWVFDGEWIGETMWCFDVPELNGAGKNISTDNPYHQRREVLEAIAPILESQTQNAFRLLPTYRTSDEKKKLVAMCKSNNAEGIMVKQKDARYWKGKRSPDCLKAKFVETVDCIVTKVGREGKRSVAIALFDGAKLIDVGACTVTDKILATVKVGDVIEVKYLYATAERKVYQPSFLKIRDDRTPESCMIEQLKFGNKEVLGTWDHI